MLTFDSVLINGTVPRFRAEGNLPPFRISSLGTPFVGWDGVNGVPFLIHDGRVWPRIKFDDGLGYNSVQIGQANSTAKTIVREGTRGFAFVNFHSTSGAITPIPDSDGDLIPDERDNCPLQPNPDQSDTDGDGEGDVCDADDDNDGILDVNDNCQFTFNPDQIDVDGDDIGDACDSYVDPVGGAAVLVLAVVGLDLPNGLENSLSSTINSALTKLADGNVKNDHAACNKLTGFINQVNAQAGKKIDFDQAEVLIWQAEAVIGLICP